MNTNDPGREPEPTDAETKNLQAALSVRMDGGGTVRDYFRKLLETLWTEAQGFSGKRPFGNSDWQYDVYVPLISEGFIDGLLDDDGDVEILNELVADKFILRMIAESFKSGARPMPQTPNSLEAERELRYLLSTAVDAIVLQGHAMTAKDWERACLLSGRYCEPFLGFTMPDTPAPDEVAQLRAEVARLKDWKESALSVDPPRQEIGRALGVALGDSVHDKILPGIERLTARIADLERENAALKMAGDNLWPCAIAHAAIYQRDHGEKYLHPTHAASLSEWIRLVPEGKRTLEEAGLVPPTTAAPGKEPTDAE